MKNIITITTLLAAGTALANATDFSKIAGMSDLVGSATNNSVVESSEWLFSGGSVYDFSASNAYFSAGSYTSVIDALTASSGYVTIAAWVNLSSTSGYQTIFGFGESNKGFKFSVKDNKLAFVTKSKTETVTGSTVFSATDTWTLVGVSFNAGTNGTQARIFWGTESGAYETKTGLTAWAAPSNELFAIGSTRPYGYEEGFNGQMAGLSVFTSTGYLSGSDIATAMGNAPIVIPEPSAFGLLAGAGALALVAARRRRRAK